MLLSAKGGDPADAEAVIGDWLWDEIWTNDPDTIKEFYRYVLGYDEMGSNPLFLTGNTDTVYAVAILDMEKDRFSFSQPDDWISIVACQS